MKRVATRPLIELHAATLLIAWAAVIAKAIDADRVDAFQKTGLRCLFAAPLLLLVAAALKRKPFGAAVALRWHLLAAGVCLALHWGLFFWSVQVSTVAVGQLAVYTFPIWTTLAEAALHRRPPSRASLANGALVLAGIALLFVGDTGSLGGLRALSLGLAIGVASALCYTARNLINAPVVRRSDGITAMAWQSVVVAIVLTPWLLAKPMAPSQADWVLIALLGVVVTAVGHTMFIASFRHFPVAAASLITCLQPIYSAGYAWATLGERPTIGLLLGGALILLAVVRETRATGEAAAQSAAGSPPEAAPGSPR